MKKYQNRKPSEIDIRNEDLSISVLSEHRESLSSVAPDQKRIRRKDKRNKNFKRFDHEKRNYSRTSKPRFKKKQDIIPYVEKLLQNKLLHCVKIR